MLNRDHNLLESHLRATVAAHRDSLVVRTRESRANRRRNAEAHRAHAAGSEKVARDVVAEELGGPHLLLSDIRDHDGLAARRTVDGLDHLLWHYHALVHRLV